MKKQRNALKLSFFGSKLGQSPVFFCRFQTVLLPFDKHSRKHIPEGIKSSSWLHTHTFSQTLTHKSSQRLQGPTGEQKTFKFVRELDEHVGWVLHWCLKRTRRLWGHVWVFTDNQMRQERYLTPLYKVKPPRLSVCVCGCEWKWAFVWLWGLFACIFSFLFLMWCLTRVPLLISPLIMSSMIYLHHLQRVLSLDSNAAEKGWGRDREGGARAGKEGRSGGKKEWNGKEDDR